MTFLENNDFLEIFDIGNVKEHQSISNFSLHGPLEYP
jgi:hypothetical protein